MRERVEPCVLEHREEFFLSAYSGVPQLGRWREAQLESITSNRVFCARLLLEKAAFLSWRGCADPSLPSLGFEPVWR